MEKPGGGVGAVRSAELLPRGQSLRNLGVRWFGVYLLNVSVLGKVMFVNSTSDGTRTGRDNPEMNIT